MLPYFKKNQSHSGKTNVSTATCGYPTMHAPVPLSTEENSPCDGLLIKIPLRPRKLLQHVTATLFQVSRGVRRPNIFRTRTLIFLFLEHNPKLLYRQTAEFREFRNLPGKAMLPQGSWTAFSFCPSLLD